MCIRDSIIRSHCNILLVITIHDNQHQGAYKNDNKLECSWWGVMDAYASPLLTIVDLVMTMAFWLHFHEVAESPITHWKKFKNAVLKMPSVTLTNDSMTFKSNQPVAQLYEMLSWGLTEIPSQVQELPHSQDLWKMSSVTLTFEPMAFSMLSLSSVHASG